MVESEGSAPRILVVEDELAMRTALTDRLEREGYRVLAASDGEMGLERAIREKPDLILLDIMMPRVDGYSLCAELRRLASPPAVLMITGRGAISDRVRGLDAGADDYLVKPFSSDELLARVRALLRRAQRSGPVPQRIALGEVEIDLVRQRAFRGKVPLSLTAREYAMLRLLVASADEPVSRERFLDVVWGYTAFPSTRTVDAHIAALRAKIEDNPERPRWITTVHGVGYRLEQFTTP
jgi:DNA-binding response OmpR family regulator